ncbi:hypothetical protein [Prosthecobacter sp.]|uniref:hypothetical protein n=1 Tax=Prosthecobacter sp. TaxID=1965333 RepID=UPI0037C76840
MPAAQNDCIERIKLMSPPPIQWPDGKKFAFTIFDDTDASTVANSAPVYALLRDLGFRTTKSVWALEATEPPVVVGGATCAEDDYRAWALQLQTEGFEIGFHNACCHHSKRERTLAGLRRFEEIFGHPPRSMANHTGCRENLYWGADRVTGLHRFIYQAATLGRKSGFKGHVEGDEYFWGDICKERIAYARNFVFPDINTLRACPLMPYHDPLRPWVNEWYASSEGGVLTSFLETLSEENQDRLEAEGGACVMYAHLGKFFRKDGVVSARFRELMERLAAKNGWFVPVSAVLDHIVAQRGHHTLTDSERRQLERRWLLHKFTRGES